MGKKKNFRKKQDKLKKNQVADKSKYTTYCYLPHIQVN